MKERCGMDGLIEPVSVGSRKVPLTGLHLNVAGKCFAVVFIKPGLPWPDDYILLPHVILAQDYGLSPGRMYQTLFRLFGDECWVLTDREPRTNVEMRRCMDFKKAIEAVLKQGVKA